MTRHGATAGVAFDREEHSLGISAVGTAFRDQGGAVYAISIPTPSNRAEAIEDRVVSLLLAARDKLGQMLGPGRSGSS